LHPSSGAQLQLTAIGFVTVEKKVLVSSGVEVYFIWIHVYFEKRVHANPCQERNKEYSVYLVGLDLNICNICIRRKTGAQNIVKEIKQWLQDVQRMDTDRIPKQALQYRPKGRRNIGRPRKRWRDQLHLED
jgi:hypothetical protein